MHNNVTGPDSAAFAKLRASPSYVFRIKRAAKL